ncbi:MAG: hypothetical protein ACE15B_08405 [Bryobacteraceae bacterium]
MALLLLPAAAGAVQRGGFARRGPGFGFHARGFHGRSFGFARPVYAYGYYGPYYSYYGNYPYYAPQPAVTVVSAYPAGPQPAIVIHQTMAPPPLPRVRVYEPAAEAAAGPPLYLLAFKDGVIRAALAYWTEGAQVHWLGTDHKQQSAALEKLDRELSQRLNRERRVSFPLP